MNAIIPHNFFHGTNSFFIDYISRYGFGGYNLAKESKALELLSVLNEIAKLEIPEKYKTAGAGLFQSVVNQMLLQGGGDSMNWQHGAVYITPSRNRALRYAVKNKLGSEICTTIFQVYDLLIKEGIDKAKDVIAHYSIINELFEKNGEPIVIEISDLTQDDLLSEGGASPKTALCLLDEISLKDEIEFGDLTLDDIGFRLNKVIPFEDLKIYQVRK